MLALLLFFVFLSATSWTELLPFTITKDVCPAKEEVHGSCPWVYSPKYFAAPKMIDFDAYRNRKTQPTPNDFSRKLYKRAMTRKVHVFSHNLEKFSTCDGYLKNGLHKMKEIYTNYRDRTKNDVDIAGFTEIVGSKVGEPDNHLLLAERLAELVAPLSDRSVHFIMGITGSTIHGYKEGAVIAVFGKAIGYIVHAGFVCPKTSLRGQVTIPKTTRGSKMTLNRSVSYEVFDGIMSQADYRCVLYVHTAADDGSTFNYGIAHNRLTSGPEGQQFMSSIRPMMREAKLHVLGGDFNKEAAEYVHQNNLDQTVNYLPSGKRLAIQQKYFSVPLKTNSILTGTAREDVRKVIYPSVVSKYHRDNFPAPNAENARQRVYPIGTSVNGRLIDYHIVKEIDFVYEFTSYWTLWRNTGPLFVASPTNSVSSGVKDDDSMQPSDHLGVGVVFSITHS